MNYLLLEQALNTIVTGAKFTGPFYGYATDFELLFKKNKNNPDKLAVELSKLILKVGGVGKESTRKFMSVEEYAKIMNRTPYTIRKWCREDKIPSARKLGNNWMIE